MSLTREQIAELTETDIKERLAFQDRRIVRFLGNSAIVPANGNVELTIAITGEGDFLCKSLRGRIIPSDYQTFYGVSINIFDNTKSELVQKCSADSILTPGYGIAPLVETEFVHLFERNGIVRILLANATAVDQTVFVNLLGERLR